MADEDLVRITQTQRLSEQNMQNFSFDSEFEVIINEIAGYDVSSDSLKRIAVDSLGRLKIVLSSITPATSVLEYSEITIIADNVVTTIHTHTVVSTDLMVDQIIASGTVDAEYRLVINGSTKAKYFTSEQDRTAKFNFPFPQKFIVGTVIDIKVVHFNTSVTGDFNASLIGHK